MAINVEQLSGIAFLAFPEQTELLLSELSSRFNFCEKPESFFGELIYFSNKVTTTLQFFHRISFDYFVGYVIIKV